MSVGKEVLAVKFIGAGQRPDADTGVVVNGPAVTVNRDYYTNGQADHFPSPCTNLPPEMDGKDAVQYFEESKSSGRLMWRCRFGNEELHFHARRYRTKSGEYRRVLERNFYFWKNGQKTPFLEEKK
jgi:hypothetical protein